MSNNTQPLLQILDPFPSREYTTIGVPEAALQNFWGLAFVMSSAGGYIEYDGTTDPNTVDVRFAPEPPHNWPTYMEGRNQLEVLENKENLEIEITAYNAGTVLTQANLQPGKTYGLTKIAAGTTGNKTGHGVWVLDIAKTAGTVACATITSINLRGFLGYGAAKDFNTGGIGDKTARVLVSLKNFS